MSARSDELDIMDDQQAIISLEREFRGWMIYRDGQGMLLNSCFARNHGIGARVSGEDWADLRDELIRWRWRQDG